MKISLTPTNIMGSTLHFCCTCIFPYSFLYCCFIPKSQGRVLWKEQNWSHTFPFTYAAQEQDTGVCSSGRQPSGIRFAGGGHDHLRGVLAPLRIFLATIDNGACLPAALLSVRAQKTPWILPTLISPPQSSNDYQFIWGMRWGLKRWSVHSTHPRNRWLIWALHHCCLPLPVNTTQGGVFLKHCLYD